MKTIKQKAKAYDEAIKKAKERYSTCYSPALLEYIFPELSENNDKEIRKDIISNLKRYINCIKDGYDAHSAKNFVIKDIDKQIAWLEKQGKKNLDDEVEPKFHEGDWIGFNGFTLYIKEVVKGYYRTISVGGINNSYDWDIDNIARLWSIEDAKDGDVLTWDDTTCVVLFKNIKNSKCFISYCFANNISFEIGASHYIKGCHPANKEQCDLLFQKMKESGYTFDFEKKELKKIGNEIEIPFGAKDSELQEVTYHIPKGFHAEIDNDKVVIKKGKKPTAWSEDDDKIVKNIIAAIDTLHYHGMVNWLKSLKQRIGE